MPTECTEAKKAAYLMDLPGSGGVNGVKLGETNLEIIVKDP